MEHLSETELRYALEQAALQIRIGDTYRHYKGNNYRVTGYAIIEATMEVGIIYQALYGQGLKFVRAVDDWQARVEVDGELIPRFARVRPGAAASKAAVAAAGTTPATGTTTSAATVAHQDDDTDTDTPVADTVVIAETTTIETDAPDSRDPFGLYRDDEDDEGDIDDEGNTPDGSYDLRRRF